MQAIDWDDLRFVLAVARGGSLAAAAAGLGVDATTVGRRLRSAEAALGSQLFERRPGGALRPTAAGDAALAEAEVVEAAVSRLAIAAPAGLVRVTAVPILVGRVLVPASADLARMHPGLRLVLAAEARGASLIRREADLALRLARPASAADGAVLARRIGRLSYAAYAAAAVPCGGEATLPWVGYEDAMADLPQARWLAEAGRRDGSAAVALNDAEAVVQAIRAGLGRSLLPRAVADGIAGLRQLPPSDGLAPPPDRELWLLSHPEGRRRGGVVAVAAWIERTIAALGAGARR